MNTKRQNLLGFQWSVYPEAHRNRRNLTIHILTVPVFMAGTVLALSAPWTGLWSAPLGLVAMLFAIGAQGRGHKHESTPPVPFRGPRDVVLRLFAEQWITFPRFVLTGGFGRAWRETR